MRLGLMPAIAVSDRKTMLRNRHSQGGTLWIMGETGGAGRLAWRTNCPDECARARGLFDSMLWKGYHAFVVGATRPGRSITAFEPALAHLMLVPGPAGGWEDCDAAAWNASVTESRSLLRNWLAALLNKNAETPAQPPAGTHERVRERRELLAALLRLLSPRQRQCLRESDYFYLTGGASGIRYRVRANSSANIDQLDASGAVQYRLGTMLACEPPLAGKLVIQVLHLQDPVTEYPFLAAAQVFPADGPITGC